VAQHALLVYRSGHLILCRHIPLCFLFFGGHICTHQCPHFSPRHTDESSYSYYYWSLDYFADISTGHHKISFLVP